MPVWNQVCSHNNEVSISMEMTEEQRRARQVTIEALDLSRSTDPDNQIEKILARIAGRYGEDSIREFVRMTLVQGKSVGEASTVIHGDAAVGQQLQIAISCIEQSIDTGR